MTSYRFTAEEVVRRLLEDDQFRKDMLKLLAAIGILLSASKHKGS